MKTSKCEICDAQKEEESPAAGHKPQNVWIVDDDHKHHYQECQICHQKLEDTYGEHHYVPYGDDWQCSVCGQIHAFDCDGRLIPDASRSTCSHLIGYCSDCGLELRSSVHRASLQTIIRSARVSARFAAHQTQTTSRRHLTPIRAKVETLAVAVTPVAAATAETPAAVTQAVEMTAEETPAEICKEHHKRKK